MNAEPSEAMMTPPSPIPRGPPQFKNFSLGAQTATVLSPPTTPKILILLSSN